jgi:hypothetical protein
LLDQFRNIPKVLPSICGAILAISSRGNSRHAWQNTSTYQAIAHRAIDNTSAFATKINLYYLVTSFGFASRIRNRVFKLRACLRTGEVLEHSCLASGVYARKSARRETDATNSDCFPIRDMTVRWDQERILVSAPVELCLARSSSTHSGAQCCSRFWWFLDNKQLFLICLTK